MEVQGFIKKVQDAQVVSDKFTKREVWVETTDQYPQTLNIQFTQDKCSLLDSYKVGDSVTIGINLNGRTWTSPQGEEKCFNTITGWMIKKSDEGSNSISVKGNIEKNFQEDAVVNDDLPF